MPLQEYATFAKDWDFSHVKLALYSSAFTVKNIVTHITKGISYQALTLNVQTLSDLLTWTLNILHMLHL